MYFTEKEELVLNLFPFPVALEIIKHDRIHQITDYRTKWRDIHRELFRKTNRFALEPVDWNPTGTANFDRLDRVTYQISRNGDLINNMYIQVRLPPLETEARNPWNNPDANRIWTMDDLDEFVNGDIPYLNQRDIASAATA